MHYSCYCSLVSVLRWSQFVTALVCVCTLLLTHLCLAWVVVPRSIGVRTYSCIYYCSLISVLHWSQFLVALVCGAASMLCKEHGVTVFGVCFAYDLLVMVQEECCSVSNCSCGGAALLYAWLCLVTVVRL